MAVQVQRHAPLPTPRPRQIEYAAEAYAARLAAIRAVGFRGPEELLPRQRAIEATR